MREIKRSMQHLARHAFMGMAVLVVAAVCFAPSGLMLNGNSRLPLEDDPRDLLTLSAKVAARYGVSVDIEIEEPGPVLRATIKNSPFDGWSEPDQKAQTRQIARYMMWSYPGKRRMRRFVVEFVRTNPLGLYVAEDVRAYGFLRGNLR